MTESKINPKLLVSDYFDALINRVDIYTEEQLEKYSNQATIENPDKTNTEQHKSVIVCDFLNSTREKMIKISEAQDDALNRLDSIRNDIKMEEMKAEEIFEKVFANRFLFLIQINKFGESRLSHDTTRNELPFKLFLIKASFYIDESQMFILR